MNPDLEFDANQKRTAACCLLESTNDAFIAFTAIGRRR
jgi:hypothetical protein